MIDGKLNEQNRPMQERPKTFLSTLSQVESNTL